MLLSDHAERTILSISVLFLVAGFVIGRGAFGWVDLRPDAPVLETLAELSVYAILFVEGAQLRVWDVAQNWRRPGRALWMGLPITLGLVGTAAHLLLDLPWGEAMLMGAIFTPTDPVFVASILKIGTVPLRLRRILGIEASLNDGLAKPLVTIFLALSMGEDSHPLRLLLNVAVSLPLGAAISFVILELESRSFFGAVSAFRPLCGVAIAIVAFGLSQILGVNLYLSGVAAGVTLVTMRPALAKELRNFGVPLAELLKLFTLMLFGASLTLPSLLGTGMAGLAFAAIVLVVVRPVAIWVSFLGHRLPWKEWAVVAWFGPRGFASLLFAVTALRAGAPRGDELFEAAALVIVISIIAHSSTDVLVARSVSMEEEGGAEKAHPA